MEPCRPASGKPGAQVVSLGRGPIVPCKALRLHFLTATGLSPDAPHMPTWLPHGLFLMRLPAARPIWMPVHGPHRTVGVGNPHARPPCPPNSRWVEVGIRTGWGGGSWAGSDERLAGASSSPWARPPTHRAPSCPQGLLASAKQAQGLGLLLWKETSGPSRGISTPRPHHRHPADHWPGAFAGA